MIAAAINLVTSAFDIIGKLSHRRKSAPPANVEWLNISASSAFSLLNLTFTLAGSNRQRYMYRLRTQYTQQ